MQNRNEITFNLFIGKTLDGEYVFLDYAFKHYGLKGLTGSWFYFLTDEDLDNIIENYDCTYEWKEAVANDKTELWLEEWSEEFKQNADIQYFIDTSSSQTKWLSDAVEYASERELHNYTATDCCHAGRIFNEEYLEEGTYSYFIPENLEKLKELYKEYEVTE